MIARGLIRKVLWGKKPTWQYLIASGGYATGLLIIMGSFLLYFELINILAPKANDDGLNYLIINKEVSLANTLSIKSTGFNQEELDELKAQPFTEKVSPFTSSKFSAFLSAGENIPFSTAAFFESVDNEVIDDLPEGFNWSEGDKTIPVILSQDFLNLYNFGFAPTQGLPVLSKAAFKLITLDLAVSGPGGNKNFKMKVVGFSERYPTLLVPKSFMEWANDKIGNSSKSDPKRLVLKVKEVGDKAIPEYLFAQKYKVGGEKMESSKKVLAVKLASAMIGIIGAAFVLLALVAFLTGFRALIAEKKEEIALLMQLGYGISAVTFNLLTPFALRIGLILLVNLGIIYLLSTSIEVWINDFGFETIGFFPTGSWLSGAIFTLITLMVNAYSVWVLVKKNFR